MYLIEKIFQFKIKKRKIFLWLGVTDFLWVTA